MFIEDREGDARAQNHNSLTCPEESNYTGRTVERNEHHRYAAVISQMAESHSLPNKFQKRHSQSTGKYSST